MSGVSFIAKITLIIFIIIITSSAITAQEKRPIIITSRTLIADNKANTATFEGSVVAKTEDIIIYSDRMTVFYDSAQGRIIKIYASGNVRVQKKGRAIFSREATYFGDEEKIIFTGEPKAVEGENVITGTQIIYSIKDDRSIVEGSKVFLKDKGRLER